MLRIDKLLNCIENVHSGEIYDAEIYELNRRDLSFITTGEGWHFDWGKELAMQGKVYKMVIKGEKEIQGLISIEDRQTYLFLPLIETAPHNFGRNKKYRNVPKGLTAFACKQSFEMGYHGEVAFIPKTKLIQHYETELGAIKLPGAHMMIESESAEKLVSLYYKDFSR